MKSDLSFLFLLDLSLGGVLVMFNVWNWFLCLTGFTTIEFWKRQGMSDTDNVYDYSFETIRDNLFVIFGTIKPLRILSPSMRALPFTGLEWSFVLKDLGYDEEGYKWTLDDEETAPCVVEMSEIK